MSFFLFVVSVNIIYFHFHYMTHHSVSKTALSFSCLQNVMVCYTVTMEKVQIIVSDGTRVEPLSKMYTIQLISFCGQNRLSESTLPIL
jgi:hypothetical protein